MTALGKLQFTAAEMELALFLARHAPNDFLGRAVARHVAVRAKDFIALCYDASSALRKAGGAVADVRKRLDAYRDQFEEYYATTRTKLGAHVQPVEFGERLELWTDLEVGKLSYFVDGAREVYDAFAALSPTDYSPYAAFAETTDPELLERLAGHAKDGAADSYTRIGADVFAASRPRTVSVLNFTPVHQRAGELAAIDEWVHGEWAMLQVLDEHPNAARIVRSRILTDIVSFADCLTTRSDGDPAYRYPGLDELLKPDGDPSAITGFRALYRFQEKLDELRAIRNHVGAHLDREVTRDVAMLLRELDGVDWAATFRFYDRLRSVYRMTCKRTHFLVGYLANGQRLNGLISRADEADNSHVVRFDPANAAVSAAPQLEPARSFGIDSALDAWLAEGPEADEALSFLSDAFMSGPAIEAFRVEDAHVVRPIELRAAHVGYRERLLSELDTSRLVRLLELASACAHGDPEPLGVVLTAFYKVQRPKDEAVLLALTEALGKLPVRDAEWMRGALRETCTHDAALVSASAIAALHKSLVQDRTAATAHPDRPAILTGYVLPALEKLTPERRLLALLVISSRFAAGVSGAHGQAADYEDRDVLFATCLTLAQVVGDRPPLFNTWRVLVRGRDYVGAAVLVGDELAKRSHADARYFPAAAASNMILPSSLPDTAMQSLCNLAGAQLDVGDAAKAIATATHVLRADPLALELHFALMPLLVKAGVPRERVRALLEERLATYATDPRLDAVIDAARVATAEPAQS